MEKTASNVVFVCSIKPMAGQYLVLLQVNGKEHFFLEDTREEALNSIFNIIEPSV